MTRDDPFEKLLREERRQREFPLWLCIGALAATGLSLAASALGMRWGAAPPEGDALRQAWDYVNLAVLWTWLLVWPVAALRRRELRRRGLLFDAAVLVISVAPAVVVAAFLSDVPWRAVERAAAVQAGVAVLTMGILSWNTARRQDFWRGSRRCWPWGCRCWSMCGRSFFLGGRRSGRLTCPWGWWRRCCIRELGWERGRW